MYIQRKGTKNDKFDNVLGCSSDIMGHLRPCLLAFQKYLKTKLIETRCKIARIQLLTQASALHRVEFNKFQE